MLLMLLSVLHGPSGSHGWPEGIVSARRVSQDIGLYKPLFALRAQQPPGRDSPVVFFPVPVPCSRRTL